MVVGCLWGLHSHSMSNPTTVLRLCCRWGCDNLDSATKHKILSNLYYPPGHTSLFVTIVCPESLGNSLNVPFNKEENVFFL